MHPTVGRLFFCQSFCHLLGFDPVVATDLPRFGVAPRPIDNSVLKSQKLEHTKLRGVVGVPSE